MKYSLFFMAVAFAVPAFVAAAEEPVCTKCQKIREFNAAHPENNITWYEDWQKDHPETKAAPEPPKESDKKILLAGCGCGGKGKGDQERPRGPRGT